MGAEDSSVDDSEYNGSTVHHQIYSKQGKTQIADSSNEILDELNNSLVFGNDMNGNEDTQKDVTLKTFERESEISNRETQNLTVFPDEPTQDDSTFGLQNNPNETPFLDKLKDPFENNDNNSSKLYFQTPLADKIDNGANDTFAIPNKSKNHNIFAKIREKANETCLEYDTQNRDILGNSGFMNSRVGDNQIVYDLDDTDTNLLREKTQENNILQGLKDTQVINQNNDTQLIESVDEDIQRIKGPTQTVGNEAQRIEISTQDVSNDTQLIEPIAQPHIGNESIHTISEEKEEEKLFSPKTQMINTSNAVQIPSTVERITNSRREVVNTQEEIETSFSQADLGNIQIYSSSQKHEVYDKEEEIRTDDEKEDEDCGVFSTKNDLDIEYEDSVINHNLKAKIMLSGNISNGLTPHKVTKRVSKTANKSPNIRSTQVTLAQTKIFSITPKNSTVPNLQASPNEIEESSPLTIRKADILKLPSQASPPRDDIPLKSNGNSLIQSRSCKLNPPSSPTNQRVSSPEISDLSHSVNYVEINQSSEFKGNFSDCNSELEDVDVDEEDNKRSEGIVVKRRKHYILDSQSESQIISKDIGIKSGENEGSINNIHRLTSVSNIGILREEKSDILAEESICSPESVWASYNLKMYTGTIKKSGYEYSTVEFEEGIYEIKNSDLYVLDIRIGDTIRLRSSKSKYFVTGLSYSEPNEIIKCMRGYNFVYLKRSSAKVRKSDEIGVQLSKCYMEVSDWVQHQQNYKLIYNNQDILKQVGSKSFLYKVTDNMRTPISNNKYFSTPDPTDSITKYENGPFSSPSKIYETRAKVSPRKKLKVDDNGKIFSKKLFCLTTIDEGKKQVIKQLIKENGGILLDEGLNEIFDYSRNDDGSLLLKSEYLDGLNFAAMISSTHCRSAKYLQALALGWPILSDVFIYDCVKDHSRIDQWPIYLLPAGQSKYLISVKSLDVFKFRFNYENNKGLVEQLKNNSNLLQNFDIIVFNNKVNQNTLSTCEFIFYTFGAKSLKYCEKYNEVISYLRQLTYHNSSKIIIYDEGETIRDKLVELQALSELSEITGSTRYRSHSSRARNRVTQNNSTTVKKSITVGLITWEWVVQCVISGYIWDPETVIIKI